MHEILHYVLHALKHSAQLLPFLFITYLIMEATEHATENRTKKIISKSGKVGPLFGAILGAVPQCGFSSVIAGLYSGNVITLGTLVAIFLSTSDEMIPVMISNKVPASMIFTVIAAKVLIALIVGFGIDLLYRKKREIDIEHICEEEGCHCEAGIWRSALHHSLKVFVFIFAVSLALELIIGAIGEERLAGIISGVPVVSNVISAAVGLIPNCASSVIITELYLEGVLSAGAMMSGLLTGAGLGTIVLFRTNKNIKQNLLILAMLWAFGVIFGLILDILNFGALL